MKIGKLSKALIILYLLVLIVLGIIIYLFPQVNDLLPDTYVAEYGNIRVYDNAVGYIIRDEKVYYAESNGEANRYAQDGDLVKKNSNIMQIITEYGTATPTQYVNETVGVVCYYVDGHEETLNETTMYDLKKRHLEDLNLSAAEDIPIVVEMGEPVYKITSNNEWFIVTYVDFEQEEKYIVGRTITVDLPSDEIEATIIETKKEGDFLKIILETDMYYDDFARLRTTDVRLVTSDSDGLLINNSSITEVDGQRGVYIKLVGGDSKFVNINELITDGEKTIVSTSLYYDSEGLAQTTIDPYDEIFSDPIKGKESMEAE